MLWELELVKKILKFAKVYKTDIIAATVKANQLQKEQQEQKENVGLLHQTEDIDNDQITITAHPDTTPKDGN